VILVLDIGNTHIHLGLFTGGALRGSWDLSTDTRRTADEYSLQLATILGDEISLIGAIVSSVVPRISTNLAEAVQKACHVEPMVVTSDVPMGIHNGYLHPEEVGMDRLASAVGGNLLYGAPLLVLDFGTAITLEYLAEPESESGLPIYRGGVIMPGIELAAEALARGTAQLPPIDISKPAELIGRTTVESIRSGLINGYLGAIESLVNRAKTEIGFTGKVVATGGTATRLREHMPYIDAVEPDLTLYGLRQIYGINHNCPLPPRSPE